MFSASAVRLCSFASDDSGRDAHGLSIPPQLTRGPQTGVIPYQYIWRGGTRSGRAPDVHSRPSPHFHGTIRRVTTTRAVFVVQPHSNPHSWGRVRGCSQKESTAQRARLGACTAMAPRPCQCHAVFIFLRPYSARQITFVLRDGLPLDTVLTLVQKPAVKVLHRGFTMNSIPADMDAQVQSLISRLTLDEKISLLAGKNTGETASIDRLDIPSLKVKPPSTTIRVVVLPVLTLDIGQRWSQWRPGCRLL
jgi:hypothetical protein